MGGATDPGGFRSAALLEATEFLLLTNGEACCDLPMLKPDRKSITSCISWSVGRFIPCSSGVEPLAACWPESPVHDTVIWRTWDGALGLSSTPLVLREGVLGMEKLPPLPELDEVFLVNLEVSLDMVFGRPLEDLLLLPGWRSAGTV